MVMVPQVKIKHPRLDPFCVVCRVKAVEVAFFKRPRWSEHGLHVWGARPHDIFSLSVQSAQ